MIQKKLNVMFKLHISVTSNISISNNFRHFSTTARYFSPEEDKKDKGKGKATKEDMERWTKEENAKKDIEEIHEKDWEEKEIGEAIQESKRSEKSNTNEEAGPSNNSVVISDNESYNSDSSIDTEHQYINGRDDQASYSRQYLRKNLENKYSCDPSFASDLDVYIKAQEKQLELVKDKLSNNGLSNAERRWQEGRQDVIVKELNDAIETKEAMEIIFREDQSRIAHLYDDEGLGKTPPASPTSQADENSEDNNNSDPDNSGPSASSSNPGPTGGDSNSNEPGPTGEEGSNESYRIIIPFFILNFVAEIFEHFTNMFFF